MTTYAVGYLTFSDNELNIEFIEANTALDAGTMHLINLGYDLAGEKFETLDDLETFAFDCDAAIGVKELPR